MTIGNMYKNFLNTVKSEYTLRNSKSKILRIRLLNYRIKILNNLARIAYLFKVDIRSFDEIKYPTNYYKHNTNMMHKFIAINVNKLPSDIIDEASELRLMIIDYCKMVTEYKKLRVEFSYYLNKSFTSFGQYKDMIYNYYNEVHKVLLNGDTFRFGKRIGDFRIDLLKIDKHSTYSKNAINIPKTMELKRTLINRGLIPYNKEDADIARSNGEIYTGVPYTIYGLDFEFYIKLRWLNCSVSHGRRFKFTKYIGNNTYQSIDELANEKLTGKQILNLDCDVITKCKIANKIDTSFNNKFKRNEDYKLRYYRQGNI